jgi:tetratricopeptide (TPR) repeat protein
MSLITDALKKAQAAKLGRRYHTPDPAAIIRGGGESRSTGERSFLGSLLSRTDLSPALLVGLVSGILFFVLLFTYFFYGQRPKAKSPSAASPAGLEKRPPGLILTPPPSVPAVQPLEEAVPANRQTPLEKSPTLAKVPELGVTKSEGSRVEKKAREQAAAGEAQKRSGSPSVAVTPSLSEEVRHHFNLALSYQEERNFPSARVEYERVVQMWPFYLEARNNLGVVYKELGMYEQAIAEFKKALALNPRYPRAYHNLGVIYQLKEDWREATKNYEMALSLDRNHLSSYNNLALVFRSQKRPHEAVELLERALAINPSFAQTHYNLALVLEELGEVEQARLHYQKFVDRAGEDNSRLAERVRAYLIEKLGKNNLSSRTGSSTQNEP